MPEDSLAVYRVLSRLGARPRLLVVALELFGCLRRKGFDLTVDRPADERHPARQLDSTVAESFVDEPDNQRALTDCGGDALDV